MALDIVLGSRVFPGVRNWKGRMKQSMLVLCGALAGGMVGYFTFIWIAAHGYYGLALPGGLLGLGAGIVKNRSIVVAVCCGLAATALGLFTEWRYASFIDDGSLAYFIGHAHQLKPITLLMVLVGGFVGFWVPYRRYESIATSGPEKGGASEGVRNHGD